MSKVAIQGNASGTGTLTIAAPNTSTDRTLTLPDEAGTVLTTAGVPASAMPAGSVLQVVQAVNTTQTSTTSTAAVASPISGSITPSSSSSKIFVFCNYNGYVNGASLTAYYAIYRGATNITSPQGTRLETSASSWFGTQTLSILDSPSTTSSTTYTLYFWVQSGVTAIVNISSSPGRMILMEIAA